VTQTHAAASHEGQSSWAIEGALCLARTAHASGTLVAEAAAAQARAVESGNLERCSTRGPCSQLDQRKGCISKLAVNAVPDVAGSLAAAIAAPRLSSWPWALRAAQQQQAGCASSKRQLSIDTLMSTGIVDPWGTRFAFGWISGASISLQSLGGARGAVAQMVLRGSQVHQQWLAPGRQARCMAAGAAGGAGGGRPGQLSRVRVPKSAAINDTVMPNTTQLAVGQYGIRALTGRRVAANTIEAMRRWVWPLISEVVKYARAETSCLALMNGLLSGALPPCEGFNCCVLNDYHTGHQDRKDCAILLLEASRFQRLAQMSHT
jgi:hypothetical protein